MFWPAIIIGTILILCGAIEIYCGYALSPKLWPSPYVKKEENKELFYFFVTLVFIGGAIFLVFGILPSG